MAVDAGILEEVLYHIHNWFVYDTASVDGCEISGGALPASATSGLLTGQWYRIRGSVLNDGLHQHPDTKLSAETFDGEIDTLVIPKPLLRIVEEIGDWVTLNANAREKALASPYASESFGGYSYSIRSDLVANSASSGSVGLSGWQAEFASRLNPWRKMY